MRIDFRRYEELSEEEVSALASLRAEIDFGTPPYDWTPPEERPWRFLVRDGERLVSHVGVMERTIEVGGKPHHVGGIYSVMTRPSDRGRGYAGAALREAAAFMRDRLPRAEHGLLLCIDDRVGFYQGFGWRRVEAPVYFEQPDGRTRNGINTMVLPLRDRPWPEGEVDMQGLPW